MYHLATVHSVRQTDGQTDGQTDESIMPSMIG